MKKVLFLTCWIMSIAFITSCNNKDEMPIQNEETISLIAPNGETIASDMATLNNEVATIIAKQFGDDLEFTITGIDYADINDGYLAIVNYQLATGQASNYAKSNSPTVLSSSAIDQLHMDGVFNKEKWDMSEGKTVLSNAITSTRSEAAARNVSFVCKSASGCKPCQVKVSQIISSDKETTTISCTATCKDCKLEAYIN